MRLDLHFVHAITVWLTLARDQGNAREHSARSGLDDAYRILPGKGR